jgi:hypothetical protein
MNDKKTSAQFAKFIETFNAQTAMMKQSNESVKATPDMKASGRVIPMPNQSNMRSLETPLTVYGAKS